MLLRINNNYSGLLLDGLINFSTVISKMTIDCILGV